MQPYLFHQKRKPHIFFSSFSSELHTYSVFFGLFGSTACILSVALKLFFQPPLEQPSFDWCVVEITKYTIYYTM